MNRAAKEARGEYERVVADPHSTLFNIRNVSMYMHMEIVNNSRMCGTNERGNEPPCIRVGGPGTSPEFFFKIYISENAFQAILKPIFPYSITSILSKVRHSNTFFFAINFSFSCHPLGALVRLCYFIVASLGLSNTFLKFFD